MDWRQFVMDLGSLDAERVESVFERHGASAVTYTDAGDTPVLEPGPGETPLWRQTRVTGLFAPDTDFAALLTDLREILHPAELPRHAVHDLADRAWEREWLADFRPLRFGRRLRVCAAGQRPRDPGAAVVTLDPGLAFGTGTHPTTSLCLEWLDGLALDGRTVLDFGCGSGILAIAALVLGARRAVAVDNDPQALTATRRNATANGVADRLDTRPGDVRETFDVVVANILAKPLVEHAAWLAARVTPGGSLALSGILANQVDEVRSAYREDIDFVAPASKDDWIRLAGERPRAG